MAELVVGVKECKLPVIIFYLHLLQVLTSSRALWHPKQSRGLPDFGPTENASSQNIASPALKWHAAVQYL